MNARKWTYSTLVITLLLSVAANVGHTLLAKSTVPVELRMVGAVAWPLLVFLAVEVLVRNTWRATAPHRLARLLILIPGIPALVTSYEHMHGVLLAMGERAFIAAIGPASVDTLMIGCTLTLLFMRSTETVLTENSTVISDEELDRTLEKWSVEEVMQQEAERTAVPFELTEQEREAIAPRERKPRTGKAEHEKAVRMLLDGVSAKDVVTATDLSLATVGRFNTVARALRNDPMTDDFGSATGRVHPDLIAIMRDHMNKERAW